MLHSHIEFDVTTCLNLCIPKTLCCGVVGSGDGETHSQEVGGKVNAGNNKAGEGSGTLRRRPSESEMGRRKAGVDALRRAELTG